MPAELILTDEDKKYLLELARRTIKARLNGEILPTPKYQKPIFKEKRGAFVTLHIDGHLRGCIGFIKAYKALEETIIEMAISSAFSDPRFQPLSKTEFNKIEIEISVLSPLKTISNISEIEMGKHGVIITKGFRSGVFLPQVATETGWSKEEFLTQLCVQKAGLSAKAYLDKDTKIEIFTASVFSEKELEHQ